MHELNFPGAWFNLKGLGKGEKSIQILFKVQSIRFKIGVQFQRTVEFRELCGVFDHVSTGSRWAAARIQSLFSADSEFEAGARASRKAARRPQDAPAGAHRPPRALSLEFLESSRRILQNTREQP